MLETIAFTLSTRIYFYFLSALLGNEEVGALNAGQNIVNAVNVVMMGLMAYAIPVARKKLLERGYHAWRRWLLDAGGTIFILTGLLLLIIATYSEFIMGVLYTAHYQQYAYLVIILAIGYYFEALNTVIAAAFRTAEKPQIGVKAKVASAAFTLLWAYPGINALGLQGAAIGLVATPFIWLLVYGFYLWRGELSERRIYPLGEARL